MLDYQHHLSLVCCLVCGNLDGILHGETTKAPSSSSAWSVHCFQRVAQSRVASPVPLLPKCFQGSLQRSGLISISSWHNCFCSRSSCSCCCRRRRRRSIPCRESISASCNICSCCACLYSSCSCSIWMSHTHHIDRTVGTSSWCLKALVICCAIAHNVRLASRVQVWIVHKPLRFEGVPEYPTSAHVVDRSILSTVALLVLAPVETHRHIEVHDSIASSNYDWLPTIDSMACFIHTL
jgi:hypothetical protein